MGLLFNTTKEFMKAVAAGDSGTVGKYIAGSDREKWLAARDKGGYTAIHNAARHGQLGIINQLLEAGARVDASSSDGETPLTVAIMYGQKAAIALLIEKGADVNMTGTYAPLNFAVGHRSLDAVKLLLAAKADPDLNNSIITAAQYSQYDIATALLEAGAKLDVHDGYYRYLIHFAAMHNGLDFLKLIIDKGADLNIQDNNGHTPLHYAIMYGHKQMFDLLLEKGARTDIENNQAQTPLALAREKNNIAMVKVLEALEKKNAPAVPVSFSPSAQMIQSGDENEAWIRMGSGKVAFVGVYPEVGRKLTEIFNFSSRERIIITENLRTGAESMSPPDSFDNLAEEAVKQALDAFTKLGGKADAEAVLNPRNVKKQLRQP